MKRFAVSLTASLVLLACSSSPESAANNAGADELKSKPACPGPDPKDYPDPTLSFNSTKADFDQPIVPLEHEFPDGAAAGRLGPFPTLTTVSKALVVLRSNTPCVLPNPISVSVFTQSTCVLPKKTPSWQSTPLSAVEQIDFGTFNGSHLVKLIVPLSTPVTVAPGESVYVAVRLTTSSICTTAWRPGSDPSRALWLGQVDANGDGKVDKKLGWAELLHPTAPGVESFPTDLGFGIIK